MNIKRRAWLAAIVVTASTLVLAQYANPATSTPPPVTSAAVLEDSPVLAFEKLKRDGCRAELDSATSSSQRTRAQNCINDTTRAIAWLSRTPTPSPTSVPSATASPSGSPTTSPTPSASPSLSPPPSPTPSPTPIPAAGCMPVPSACGYPDSTNTGVPAGTALTVHTGDWHITTSGVHSGRDVTGCVYVEASTVTIRESRIRGNCWFSVRATGIGAGTRLGLVIEDTEIVMASTLNGAYGICCSEYTLTRVWIHGSPAGNAGADCVYFNTNVQVRDSFCEVGILPGNPPGNPNATSAHSDGMTSDGGDNVVLDHNTIRNPNQQTSAILVSTNSALITNTKIRRGLYAGGGYTVYCGTDAGGVDPGTEFTGNRVARDWNGAAPGYYPNGGFFGSTTHCAGLGGGNVWDDTGLPLPQTGAAVAPLWGGRLLA